jgi:hypothetical protein
MSSSSSLHGNRYEAVYVRSPAVGRENCKLIWKLQTHMKIANPYENCKRPRRNHTPKSENCKLIWKLQTDMKIANQYENCKAILTFRCMVPTWTFAIFIWETQRDWKLVPEMNFSVGLRRGKTHREEYLAKPSTNHILLLIPVRRQSDSYFKRWFLRSLSSLFS